MKQISKIILVSSMLFITSNLSFAQPNNVVLPKLFTSQKAMMQDRICGELLVGFSLVGAKRKDKQQQELAEEIATEAAILINFSSSLKNDEKLKAKEISRQIETLPATEHMSVATACTSRVKYLANSGEITEAQYNEASNAAKNILTQVSKK